MLAYKTEIIADSLDGGRFAKQYEISKVSQDSVTEDVRKRKEEGKLNPVIKDLRKEKNTDLFATGNNLNDFVKRTSSSKETSSKATTRRRKRRLLDEYEDIEDSSAQATKVKAPPISKCKNTKDKIPSLLKDIEGILPSKTKKIQSKLTF